MNDTPAPAAPAATLSLPLLPLKNTVLLPFMFMPLSVGRPGSRAAIESALSSEDKALLVVAQRDAANDSPGLAEVFSVGTRAVIKKMNRTAEGFEMLVQAIDRVELLGRVDNVWAVLVNGGPQLMPWRASDGTPSRDLG
jgi:ATP-dependent Lon protease